MDSSPFTIYSLPHSLSLPRQLSTSPSPAKPPFRRYLNPLHHRALPHISFNRPLPLFQIPEFQFRSSAPVIGNSRLPRVSSSPSLNVDGSPASMAVQENPNSKTHTEIGTDNGSILQSKLSVSTANSNEESSVFEQIPVGETGLRIQNESNSRKRKAVPKEKSKETASAKKLLKMTSSSKLQGPRPEQLMLNSKSSKIKKALHKSPVIVYLVSPKIIKVLPHEFMATVQGLTGNRIARGVRR